MRSTLLITLLLVLPPLLVSPAMAKPANRQAMEKAAKKACITGDYRKGIDILGDLFVETNDAAYVFNQGRCFQQNHRWEEALDRFAEYLRKVTNLSAGEQAKVDEYIADCKAHLPESSPPAPTPPPSTIVASGTPATTLVSTPVKEPPADSTLVMPRPVQSSHSGSGLRAAGIVVGAVGVAGVVAGIVMSMKTQSVVDQMYKDNGYTPGLESSRKSYENWGWVGYGVGAAGIVAGTALYLLGWRRLETAPATPQVSFFPVLCPNGTALFVRRTFQ